VNQVRVVTDGELSLDELDRPLDGFRRIRRPADRR